MPDDIYLTLEANAAVTQASRTRRVLIVGVPLLHILSERELRGVIAHEFGHYSGGDTRLGPWIYRTRETIGRTIGQLSYEDDDESWSQRAVRQPFIWYGHAFLRITAKISRRQEFAADALRRPQRRARRARRRTRADPRLRARLRRVLAARGHPRAAGGPAAAGVRGLPALHRARVGRSQPPRSSSRIMREEATDPYDSHPSLPERIAAVDGMPDGEPDDSPAAIALLASPDEVERRLLDFLLGDAAGEFRPVDWQDVGAEVYGAARPQPHRRVPAGSGGCDGRQPAGGGRGDRAAATVSTRLEPTGSSRPCSATGCCWRSRARAGRSRPSRQSPSAPAAATSCWCRTTRSGACETAT